jgi:hypothetical protein
MGVCNLMPIRGSDGDRIWTCLAQLGWIEDQTLPAPGLAESHRWLKEYGFSDWDLEQMQLAEEYPAGRPPKMATKNGIQELNVTTCDT